MTISEDLLGLDGLSRIVLDGFFSFEGITVDGPTNFSGSFSWGEVNWGISAKPQKQRWWNAREAR